MREHNNARTRMAGAERAATVETETGGARGGKRYLRRAGVLAEYPISARTLSNWQRRRVVAFTKIGRTVLFKREDIEAALNRFRVTAIGE
jgi:hypothetical protein